MIKVSIALNDEKVMRIIHKLAKKIWIVTV